LLYGGLALDHNIVLEYDAANKTWNQTADAVAGCADPDPFPDITDGVAGKDLGLPSTVQVKLASGAVVNAGVSYTFTSLDKIGTFVDTAAVDPDGELTFAPGAKKYYQFTCTLSDSVVKIIAPDNLMGAYGRPVGLPDTATLVYADGGEAQAAVTWAWDVPRTGGVLTDRMTVAGAALPFACDNFVDVPVNVAKAHVAIQIADVSRAAGQANPLFSYRLIGGVLMNGDMTLSGKAQIVFNCAATPASGAGVYTITASVMSDCYSVDVIFGKLTIN